MNRRGAEIRNYTGSWLQGVRLQRADFFAIKSSTAVLWSSVTTTTYLKRIVLFAFVYLLWAKNSVMFDKNSNGAFTLAETETETETEIDTDTIRLAQNPMGFCVCVCLCAVWRSWCWVVNFVDNVPTKPDFPVNVWWKVNLICAAFSQIFVLFFSVSVKVSCT